MIGAVAEQRIRAGFDDDLRATAADLQDSLRVERRAARRRRPRVQHDDAGAAPRPATPRCAASTATGRSTTREGLRRPGRRRSRASRDFGDYRVVSRAAYVVRATRAEPFGPLVADRWPRPSASCSTRSRERLSHRTISRVRLFLAFGVLGGTLLAFLGGLSVARRAMRPIAGLTRAAREVARTRDPDVTLPKPQANDEVADLAHTLEDMLRELSAARSETEATLVRQREFVADASHELRTPLTSILANLELLEAELEPASSARWPSRRCARRGACAGWSPTCCCWRAPTPGREAPRRPSTWPRSRARRRPRPAPLAAGPPALARPARRSGRRSTAWPDDLHRLALNLVENALLHTPPGTPVTVSVRRDGDSAVLEVADRGPGVPPALRERVFERFTRGGADRAPSGGSGLGLAIVKAVADAHDGARGPARGRGRRRALRGHPARGNTGAQRSDSAATVFGSTRSLTEYPTSLEELPVKSILRRRPSPALVISCIALFVSLGGVSYGVATGFIDSREIKNNEIRSADLRNNQIRTFDIRNNEVRGFDIRNSSVQGRDVALNTLTGADIAEGELGKVPSATARTRPARRRLWPA